MTRARPPGATDGGTRGPPPSTAAHAKSNTASSPTESCIFPGRMRVGRHMDSETRDLLKGSIRDLFEARDGDIVSGLEELGWGDVVADEPAAALDLLFTEQGAIGRSSSALDMVAFAELADGTRARVVHPVNGVTSGRIVGNMVQIDGVVRGEVDQPVVVATLEGTFVVDVPDSAVTAVGGFDSGSRLRRVRLGVERAAALPVEVDWADVTAAAQR